jgi:CheY-like chemotaxis protein
VTLSLLTTLLSGFEIASVDSPELTLEKLRKVTNKDAQFDFIILDHFGQTQLQEIARLLEEHAAFANTKAIHLYTPTPSRTPQIGGLFHQPGIASSVSTAGVNIDMALASATGFASTQRRGGNSPVTSFGRVVRMNKPPRRARLLQLLANLKDISIPAGGFTSSQIERALESLGEAQPLLNTANILIAEGVSTPKEDRSATKQATDNPVANMLLVKQLQKYNIIVVSTVDGVEAVREWESHPIGFFNFALFDHRRLTTDVTDTTPLIVFRHAHLRRG